MIKLFRLIG